MRILIIRLSSIGDIILTTPVLKAIKEKNPNIKIDFLVMDKFKAAIEDSPYVDNIIVFEKSLHDGLKNLYRFGHALRKNKYEYVFDLHSKFRSWIIAWSIASKTYRYSKRSFFKTLLVKMKLIKYIVDDSIVKNYFRPFRVFGVEYKGENLNFSFKETDLKKVSEDLFGHVVFAPGASKNTKKWILGNFAELAKLIYEKEKRKILLIGGKEDFEYCEEISRLSGNNCINLCGKLTLKESGALLSKSKYIVTNDSGPFHIARGVNCRSYVIFGPTSPKMFEFNENETLIYSKEKCSPCSLHGDKSCPKKHFNCMNRIKAQDLFSRIYKK